MQRTIVGGVNGAAASSVVASKKRVMLFLAFVLFAMSLFFQSAFQPQKLVSTIRGFQPSNGYSSVVFFKSSWNCFSLN